MYLDNFSAPESGAELAINLWVSGASSMPFGSKLALLKNVAGFAFQRLAFFGKVKYAEPSFAPKGITTHDI